MSCLLSARSRPRHVRQARLRVELRDKGTEHDLGEPMMKERIVVVGVVALALLAPPLVETQGPATQSGGQARPDQRSGDTPPAGSQARGEGGAPPSAVATDAAAFVREMAIAGMAEVELGRLASERASNAEVKAYGQMMVKEHTAANNELKTIATNMQLQVPAALDQKHQQLAERLGRLQGADFDRAYMEAMVAGHEEVLSKLKTRAGQTAAAGGRAGNQAGTAGRSGSPAAVGASPSGESGNPPSASASGRAQAQSQSPAQPQGRGQSQGSASEAGQRSNTRELPLNQWATKNVTPVQHHLEQAQALHRKMAN